MATNTLAAGAGTKGSVVGYFADHQKAVEAVSALHHAGWSAEKITLMSRDGSRLGSATAAEYHSEDKMEQNAATGAATGAAAGLVVGATALVAATAGPILVAGALAAGLTGGVVGGLVGAMRGWGIEKEVWPEWERAIAQGKSIVLLTDNSPSGLLEARATLEASGAEKVETHAEAADVPVKP